MIVLPQIQGAFQDYLLGRSDAVAAHVLGNARIGPADLLLVYQRGYGMRLAEALANDFPGLHGLLGPAVFEQLALTYVAAHPSHNPSLRWLGRQLPAYLTQQTDAVHPLAAGMARFDWAVAQAFDAVNQPTATMAEVLALPAAAWESFRLTFAEAVSDIIADATIGDIRRAILRDEPVFPAASGDEVRWIVWRQGEDVQYRTLAVDESAAFDLMQAGGNFGAMCQLLSDQYGNPNAALRSAQILKDWLDRGLVVVIDHDAAVSD